MTAALRNLIMLLLPVIVSCTGPGGDKPVRKNMVPVSDLVPLLTDLYIADGLLAYPPVRNIFNMKDSVVNYMEIIDKHGYTKERVDYTLRYYFLHNPRKLQKIYDQVLARLSEIQAGVETEEPPLPSGNLWNMKPFFSVPEDGAHNTLYFSVPVSDTGMYTLSLSIILFTDDQSLNPRTTVFFWRPDSTDQGVRDPWDRIDHIRDGARHTYSVSKRLTDTTFTRISGWLLDNDNQPPPWVKHAKVSGIYLFRGQVE